MSEPVDLIIPAAPKDYNKLPYVIDSVRKFIDVEAIHIIVPIAIPTRQYPGVVYHQDAHILQYDRLRLRHRPNWIFQQLLKMFQDVTQHNWFLVMDADIIVCKPIPLWTKDNKPILNLGRDQYCKPYFEFNKEVLGFGRVFHQSFVSECTLYNKQLVRDMLRFCGLTRDGFWEKVVEITTATCHPCEPEFYGSYIMHEQPDVYELRHLATTFRGKHNRHVWTDKEIREAIQDIKKYYPKIHLIALHSWE